MNTGSKIVNRVKESIESYLEEEGLKLKKDKNCRNVSSDIIESIFGYYKFRRSKNRLNGITSCVLLLPLFTRMGELKERSEINFKEKLESVFMKDLKTWSDDNLTENLAIKRKKKLAA
jgi:CRISPR/Cas system CSM-associated protein Csm2 small subunit